VSQYRRSFEIVESTWRVKDEYNLVPDASSRPPLRADDFIAPKTGTNKVCACRKYGLRAGQLALNYRFGETTVNRKVYKLKRWLAI
jgi:hypothetical protein